MDEHAEEQRGSASGLSVTRGSATPEELAAVLGLLASRGGAGDAGGGLEVASGRSGYRAWREARLAALRRTRASG